MTGQALKSLAIQNLRGCIEPFILSFEKGKNLTIVYGENGSGKSTICDALEFVGRGNVGSLDGRGLNKTQPFWSSLGKRKTDIEVKLETTSGRYAATMDKSNVVWSPSNKQPSVEILRRSQILKLVEARPGERYSEISRFINVAGVEASEASLKTLLDNVKRDRESQISRLQGSEDSLRKLYTAAGESGGNPIEWARGEASKDFSRYDQEKTRLLAVERAFQKLSAHEGSWSSVQDRLKNAEDTLQTAKTALGESLVDVAEGSGDIIDILIAARPFLTKSPAPESCPLCESKENVAGLGDRVSARIDSFQSLKTAKKNLAAAERAFETVSSEPEAYQTRYSEARESFIKSLEGEWSKDIELPSVECPADLADFDSWYSLIKELPDKWRELSTQRAAEKNAAAKIKEVLDAYEENRDLPADVEALIPRLEKALQLVREERRDFTDSILSKIADEVGRLYEVVHPGEGLKKISLQLDAKKRASLDLGAEFCGTAGVPPQAYFSESHLDTLGLCVFLALAKMESPEDTIMVIDDVLASVDEPHVERLIEMICDEAKGFRHCVITTHYRPWREKYRWGWLKNGRCQFVELGKWSDKFGLSHSKSIPEVDRLEKLLGEANPDVQAICAKAGVILEAVLDFLTQLYQCRVPRRAGERYTLGDLLPNIDKKLRNTLRVEILTGQGEDGPEYDNQPLGEILDELSRIAQARNVFGAHFNELSFELLDSDAIGFSEKVLELSRLLTDEDHGWPRNNKSGSYWATTGETRRLHPLVQPK